MANLLHFTEQFDNAYWDAASFFATVTADTHAQPSSFGTGGSLADTLADNDAGHQCAVLGTYEDIVNDSSDYTASIFIRKDANTSRFTDILLRFVIGTGFTTGISVNTSTGAIANSGLTGVVAPDASGSIDFDALWWRVWFRKANNNTGNTGVRLQIYPAITSTLGGAEDSAVTGTVVMWGANLTKTSTVQTYEPDPFYPFVSNDLNVFLMEPVIGSSVF